RSGQTSNILDNANAFIVKRPDRADHRLAIDHLATEDVRARKEIPGQLEKPLLHDRDVMRDAVVDAELNAAGDMLHSRKLLAGEDPVHASIVGSAITRAFPDGGCAKA